MALIDYFRRKRNSSASVAKERLQIILAREHTDRDGPDFLPDLKRDLIEVVSKYIDIDIDNIKIELDREDNCEILELNIPLSDAVQQVASSR